jgi:hypothetical protein
MPNQSQKTCWEIGDNGKQLDGTMAMLNLERILQQDRLIRAMTGLNRKAFEALLPSFTEAYRTSI